MNNLIFVIHAQKRPPCRHHGIMRAVYRVEMHTISKVFGMINSVELCEIDSFWQLLEAKTERNFIWGSNGSKKMFKIELLDISLGWGVCSKILLWQRRRLVYELLNEFFTFIICTTNVSTNYVFLKPI